MTADPRPIDISAMPDLMRLVKEVEATKKPRKLVRNNKPVAVLMPTNKSLLPKKKRVKTKADFEAFLSAAGGWKDIDTDTLVANIYATRRQSNRPPVNV